MMLCTGWGGDQFQTVMTKVNSVRLFIRRAGAGASPRRLLLHDLRWWHDDLAVGIAESYAQEVPVLALVGQPSAQEGRGVFPGFVRVWEHGQCRAVVAFYRAKYVTKITDAAEFWPGLSKTLRQPFSGRCRTCRHADPRDLMTAEVGERPADFRVVGGLSKVRPVCPGTIKLCRCAMWQDLARARARLC